MTIQTVEPRDTTTALATTPHGHTGSNLIREAAAVMADAHALAKAVANTQMIPKHFQGKPDECAAAMLYGASLGLDPMQSVRQIYVVHGQAALYARGMVALVLGAGHEVWTVSSADEAVTVAGRRRNSEHVEQITWDYRRAQKAGYTNNSKYSTDPQAMFYSKAASEVCRKIAPDVLSGVYAVEELQMEQWDDRPATVTAQQPQSAAERMSAIVGATTPPEPETVDVAPMLDPRSTLGKRMFATLRDAQVGEDERKDWIGQVVGRHIDSSAELTEAEASAVIDAAQAQAAALEPATDGGDA